MTDLAAERAHHDAFYATESEAIFRTPIFDAAHELVWRVLAEVLARYDKPAILSLGSGDGFKELRAAPSASSVLGIELSPVATNAAAAKAAAAGFNHVSFVAGDLADATRIAAGMQFDIVWVLATLHHLSPSERERCLAMSFALLRPGGTFVSIDPNRYRLVALAKPLVQRVYGETHSPDEREIAPATVRSELQRAGFTDVQLRTVDFGLGPLAWVWPRCPAWLARVLLAAETVIIRLPLLGRVASGFAAIARKR
jgi:SAM-dependent methyltransferase